MEFDLNNKPNQEQIKILFQTDKPQFFKLVNYYRTKDFEFCKKYFQSFLPYQLKKPLDNSAKFGIIASVIIFVLVCIYLGIFQKDNTKSNSDFVSILTENNKEQIKSEISGSGDRVKKIQLNKGIAIFNLKYSGKRNFIVWLKDAEGKDIELLVNDIGSYNGEKTATLKKDGTYILEIHSAGSWTINVK